MCSVAVTVATCLANRVLSPRVRDYWRRFTISPGLPIHQSTLPPRVGPEGHDDSRARGRGRLAPYLHVAGLVVTPQIVTPQIVTNVSRLCYQLPSSLMKVWHALQALAQDQRQFHGQCGSPPNIVIRAKLVLLKRPRFSLLPSSMLRYVLRLQYFVSSSVAQPSRISRSGHGPIWSHLTSQRVGGRRRPTSSPAASDSRSVLSSRSNQRRCSSKALSATCSV